MTDSFSGLMSDTGFQADDSSRWKEAKRRYFGRRVTVAIGAEEEIRSPFQNRRHFVQCQAVAELWSVGRDVPIHPTQAHYILAEAFVGVDVTPLGKVPRPTRTLSKAAFNKFMDDIDHHFAAEGHPLPTMEAC